MAADDITTVGIWSAEPITALGTLTSVPLSAVGMDPETLLFKCTSVAGAADVKIEFKLAQDGAGTFGSATAQDPLVSSTATEYAGKLPEEAHEILLPSAATFQLLVTELGNNADTLVSATARFRTRT
jgi:hypothetical protein